MFCVIGENGNQMKVSLIQIYKIYKNKITLFKIKDFVTNLYYFSQKKLFRRLHTKSLSSSFKYQFYISRGNT